MILEVDATRGALGETISEVGTAVESIPEALEEAAPNDVWADRTVSEDRLKSIVTALPEDTVKLDGSDVAGKSMTDESVKAWTADTANVESTLAKVVSKSV